MVHIGSIWNAINCSCYKNAKTRALIIWSWPNKQFLIPHNILKKTTAKITFETWASDSNIFQMAQKTVKTAKQKTLQEHSINLRKLEPLFLNFVSQ